MNVKEIALQALRVQRSNQNFWALMNYWHVNTMLPTANMRPHNTFSVMVYGPAKTWKSKIIGRLGRYWPMANIRERWSTLHLPRYEEIAGYDLVIRTLIVIHAHPNGLQSESLCASVQKSRWFALQYDLSDQPGIDPQPHVYDLMPILNFR